MANASYGDDGKKFDLGGPRTSSSPALVGGNGFMARDSVARNNSTSESSQPKEALPNQKGFPIQCGSELFRLSGASIMSDGKAAHLRTQQQTR